MLSWNEFKRSKRNKADVQIFEFNLENHLFKLHWALKNGYYTHSQYKCFHISDPKPRIIHKATVCDRVVHHAVFRVLYPMFDRSFIYDSYSCRVGKGTHKAVKRLARFSRDVSRNFQQPCFILKCDISQFFASIDHQILKSLIAGRVADVKALNLVNKIIDSYKTDKEMGTLGKGLPIGNLTSQLFANIYLHELDKFIKHRLKVKHYIRYTDDFAIVHKDKNYLENLVFKISKFLRKYLKLKFNSHKIVIRKFSQGIDFLGYIVFPYHKLLRTKTKKRMFKKLGQKQLEFQQGIISEQSMNQTAQSYFGLLKHCNSLRIKGEVKRIIYN